jgi:hypothetical protein
MTELSIIPECYVDTRVAEIVGQANKRFNHQHSCGDVANQLKNVFKDRMALGIIDEDKNKGAAAKYFLEFDIIKSENNLVLKKHKEQKHYLVLICPEMEKWLTNEAVYANLKLRDFELPDEMKGLKALTKAQSIQKHEGFKRFIKALIRENTPSIITLKTWIELYKKDELGTLIN